MACPFYALLTSLEPVVKHRRVHISRFYVHVRFANIRHLRYANAVLIVSLMGKLHSEARTRDYVAKGGWMDILYVFSERFAQWSELNGFCGNAN